MGDSIRDRLVAESNFASNDPAAMMFREAISRLYWQCRCARTRNALLHDRKTGELYSPHDPEVLAKHFGSEMPYFTYVDPVKLFEEYQKELEKEDNDLRAKVIRKSIAELKRIADREIAAHIAKKMLS